MNSVRFGSISTVSEANSRAPGESPMTSAIGLSCCAYRPDGPAIIASAASRRSSIAPISVVLRRISACAIAGVTPLRDMIR